MEGKNSYMVLIGDNEFVGQYWSKNSYYDLVPSGLNRTIQDSKLLYAVNINLTTIYRYNMSRNSY